MRSFKRKIATLSSLIVVLALVYVAGVVLAGESADPGLSGRLLLPSFQPPQAAEVILSSGGAQRVVLRKSGARWLARVHGEGFPASSERVEALLSAVSNLRRSKLVSTGSEYFSDFGLERGEAGRILVRAGTGKTIADLLVGKPGASGYEDYVRIDGESRVFLARSSLSFYLARDRAYWYRLFVFPDQVKESAVSAIFVSGDIPLDANGSAWSTESYKLVRGTLDSPGTWSASGQALALSQSKVDATANNLVSLQGVDLLPNPPAERTRHRALDVAVTTADGKDWRITARELAGGAQFVVSLDGQPYAYIVNTGALLRGVQPLRALVR